MSKNCNNTIQHSQPLNYNLESIDVYAHEEINSSYFNISHMPQYFTYGKTPIFLSVVDKDGKGLKSESTLLFEFKDSNGRLLYSDTANIEDVSGAAVIYVDIQDERVSKSRNSKYSTISDGIGTLTIVGELDNVPDDWKGNYNYKFTTNIEIRKSSINTSPIVLENHPSLYITSSVIDDSTISSNRGATFNSVIRTYTGLSVDNLNTVGGRIGFIEVSYKSDAFTTEQYDVLDTMALQPVELLTPTTNLKIKNNTWIGDMFNAYTNMGNNSYLFGSRYWSTGGGNILYTTPTDMMMGPLSGSGYILGDSSGNESRYLYKIIRKTTSEEYFNINYNPSGSISFYVLASPNSESLDRTGNIPYDDQGVNQVYYKRYDNFNPIDYNYAIIDGEVVTSQSFDLTNNSGSTIIQDNFTVPANNYFAVYIKNENVGANNNSHFSNISIRHRQVPGISPNYFHKDIEIFGAARQLENLDFRVRFLNPNMEPARDFRTTDEYHIVSASLVYKPEGIWVERGLGQGIQAQDNADHNINLGARYTTVDSSSLSNAKDTITVGLAAEASNLDEWGVLKSVYPGSSSMNITIDGDSHSDADYTLNAASQLGTSNIIGGWFNASRKALTTPQVPGGTKHIHHRVVGISAEAWDSSSYPYSNDSGTSSADVWAARFEHGDVFVNNRLGIGIPKEQTRPDTTLQVIGDVLVDGDITAKQYVVSSSILHITSSFSSGSTAFGDSSDDTHTFTGQIYNNGALINSESYWLKEQLPSNKFRLTSSVQIFVRGQISGSGNLVGNNLIGSGYVNATRFAGSSTTFTSSFGSITAHGNVTASGHISASSYISGSSINTDGTGSIQHLVVKDGIMMPNNRSIGSTIMPDAITFGYSSLSIIYVQADGSWIFGTNTPVSVLASTIDIAQDLAHYNDNNTRLRFEDDKIILTAGGTDFITIKEDNNNSIEFANAPITASSHISSSGTLFTSASHGDPSNLLLTYNSSSGEVHYTSSLALYPDGGGSGGSTNAAGSDTQVQFNDGGTNFGGDAGLTYNSSTDTLTVGGHVTASGNLFANSITSSNDISASGDVTGVSGSFNHIYLPHLGKIVFDSADTYIAASADATEDLTIKTDDDLFLDPDSDLNVTAGGVVKFGARGATAPGGFGSSRTWGMTFKTPDDRPIGFNLDENNSVLYFAHDNEKFLMGNFCYDSNNYAHICFNGDAHTGGYSSDSAFIGIRTNHPTHELSIQGNTSGSGFFWGNYFTGSSAVINASTGSQAQLTVGGAISASSYYGIVENTGVIEFPRYLSNNDQAIIKTFDGSGVGSGFHGGQRLTIQGGHAYGSNARGGDLVLKSGDGMGTGYGGNIILSTGHHTSDVRSGSLQVYSKDFSITAGGNVSSSGDFIVGNSVVVGTTTGSEAQLTVGGAISSSGVVNASGFQKNGSATFVDISDNTNLVGGTGITLTGDTLSTTDSEIVHDNLSGFVANEHIDHSGVSINTGTGLSGGGDITSTRTLSVDAAQTQITSVGTLTGLYVNGHMTASGNLHANSITSSNDISASGDTHTANMHVGQYIYHGNDDDTFINFTDDDINIHAGGANMLDFTQEDGGQDEITFNEEGHTSDGDIDIRMESRGDTKAFFIDAEANAIQLGSEATTHVTASGNISGSSTSQLFMGGNSAFDNQLVVGGQLTANGNIVGDGATNISNINDITASGNISSSLTGSFGNVHIGDSLTGLGIGNDDDLLLYHDGNHSYIKDNGTGNLYYRGGTQTIQNAAGSKTMAVFNAANSVDLHYNDDKKFETAPLGINVTGRVYATGNITGSNISASGDFFGATAVINASTGSSAQLTVGGDISASGKYYGDGSELSNVSATLDIDSLGALGGTGIAQSDKLVFSDAGTEKSITFSNLEDAIFGNVSADATIAAGGAITLAAAQTNVTSLLATDIKIGEDDQTKIDFGTTNEIHFAADNQYQMKLTDGVLQPISDSDVDLGSSSVRWKDTYTDTVTTTGDVKVGGHLYLDAGNFQYYDGDGSNDFGWRVYEGSDSKKRFLNRISDVGGAMVMVSSSVGIGGTGVNSDPAKTLTVEGDISASGDLYAGSPTGTYFSASNGNVEINGSDTALLEVDGNISSSADLYVEGNNYGKHIDIKNTAFFLSSNRTLKQYLPMAGTLAESTGDSYYHRMIAAYDGRLVKAFVNLQQLNPGDVTICLHTGSRYKNDISAAPGGEVQCIEYTGANDDNTYAFYFSSSIAKFREGDAVGVSYQQTDNSGNNYGNVTTVWEYNTNPNRSDYTGSFQNE